MARSRKSDSVRKDWVYNDLSYSSSSGATLTAGPATGIAFLCVSSQSARREQLFGSAALLGATNQIFSGAAVPDAGKQRVYAVEGGMVIQPTTWNTGDAFVLGARLLHGEQDTITGGWLAPTGYGIWNGVAVGTTPAQYANGGYLMDKVFVQGNVAGTAVTSSGQWYVPLRWSSRKGVPLTGSRGLFMYVESATGSISLRIRMRVRTLMAAGE